MPLVGVCWSGLASEVVFLLHEATSGVTNLQAFPDVPRASVGSSARVRMVCFGVVSAIEEKFEGLGGAIGIFMKIPTKSNSVVVVYRGPPPPAMSSC